MIDLLVYDIADPRVAMRVTGDPDVAITVAIGKSRVIAHADGRVEMTGPKLTRELAGACERALRIAADEIARRKS